MISKALNMDYRELIRDEFNRRRAREPFYSLRGYAKDLGLKHSHLSLLFRGRRGLSKHSALGVAYALGLRTFAAKRFCFLVSAQSGRSREERNLAKMGLRKKLIAQAHLKLEI